VCVCVCACVRVCVCVCVYVRVCVKSRPINCHRHLHVSQPHLTPQNEQRFGVVFLVFLVSQQTLDPKSKELCPHRRWRCVDREAVIGCVGRRRRVVEAHWNAIFKEKLCIRCESCRKYYKGQGLQNGSRTLAGRLCLRVVYYETLRSYATCACCTFANNFGEQAHFRESTAVRIIACLPVKPARANVRW